MHSSTSSSEEEIVLPRRAATITFAAAVAIFVVVLIGMEIGWRRLGFKPMPRDTVQRWALERNRVRDAGGIAVIVGSSRAQLGLDPQVLSSELGLPVFQLAIAGGSPLPVLADLAADQTFRGTVICEVTPSAFFIKPSEIDLQSSAEWVHAWHALPLVSDLETRLRTEAQSRLAVLLPQTNLRFQISSILTEHTLAKPASVRVRADRYRGADYSHEDLPRMEAHWAAGLRRSHPPSQLELRTLFEMISGWVRQIRTRGGDVVFVRIVSSGEVARTEQELWPRQQFWDPFVAAFDNHTIHYADQRELSGFVAPEGSHLDAEQARMFSHALGVLMRARGWFSWVSDSPRD